MALKKTQLYSILWESCNIEDFALRVPPFHFCGTVRLTLTVPLISELWYRYRASEMNAVKRCSVTDAP